MIDSGDTGLFAGAEGEREISQAKGPDHDDASLSAGSRTPKVQPAFAGNLSGTLGGGTRPLWFCAFFHATSL